MSRIKNELSKNSENYISRYRYLELKNFCFQYSEWKRAANNLLIKNSSLGERVQTSDISNPVEEAAEKRETYLKKIKLVEETCHEVSDECYTYLLACVVYGKNTYDSLTAKHGVLPVGRNTFYKLYRRFFLVLDTKV